jgi:NAD(P)H-nitrite reductase large subunit
VAKNTTKMVCLCNGVKEKEILRLLKRGARDLEVVKKNTLATTGCGKCKREIEGIINQFLTNKNIDSQQEINF